MQGMHRNTGRRLSGIDHLWQSVEDILTTRIGSRVMRRTYGSRLPDLIDEPFNEDTRTEMIAATVEAILNWETRFEPTNVKITQTYLDGKSRIEIDLTGNYLPDGNPIKLEGIVIQ
ncbi:GPW/gp25 family protein [Vibrio cholerae]